MFVVSCLWATVTSSSWSPSNEILLIWIKNSKQEDTNWSPFRVCRPFCVSAQCYIRIIVMAIWAILIWSSWARLGFFALVGPFFLYRTHIWSWPTLDVTNMQVMFIISWLLVTIERASSFGVTNLRCSPWARTRRDKSSITHWSPFRVFHLHMWVLYGRLSHFGALEGSLSGFEQDMKQMFESVESSVWVSLVLPSFWPWRCG